MPAGRQRITQVVPLRQRIARLVLQRQRDRSGDFGIEAQPHRVACLPVEMPRPHRVADRERIRLRLPGIEQADRHGSWRGGAGGE